MAVFTISSSPTFNTTNVDQIVESDYVLASFVNAYYQIFLDNDQYLYDALGELEETISDTVEESLPEECTEDDIAELIALFE